MRAWLEAVWKWVQALWNPMDGAPEAVTREPLRPPAAPARPVGTLRMTRALMEQMGADLRRPHAFAHERVGFLLAREAEGLEGPLLLARRYEPVGEEEYLRDGTVGARINRDAIRRVLGYALAGESVFHVHLHEHRGRPGFSPVDEANLRELIPSFCAAAPQSLHGALLLSDDHGIAWCWKAGVAGCFPLPTITVVGHPMLRWEVRS